MRLHDRLTGRRGKVRGYKQNSFLGFLQIAYHPQMIPARLTAAKVLIEQGGAYLSRMNRSWVSEGVLTSRTPSAPTSNRPAQTRFIALAPCVRSVQRSNRYVRSSRSTTMLPTYASL